MDECFEDLKCKRRDYACYNGQCVAGRGNLDKGCGGPCPAACDNVEKSWECKNNLCTERCDKLGQFKDRTECENSGCGKSAPNRWTCQPGWGQCTIEPNGTYESKDSCTENCKLKWKCGSGGCGPCQLNSALPECKYSTQENCQDGVIGDPNLPACGVTYTCNSDIDNGTCVANPAGTPGLSKGICEQNCPEIKKWCIEDKVTKNRSCRGSVNSPPDSISGPYPLMQDCTTSCAVQAQRWGCKNNGCMVDFNGEYTSEAECINSPCLPPQLPGTKYVCSKEGTGHCIPAMAGVDNAYDTLLQCQEKCGYGYICDNTQPCSATGVSCNKCYWSSNGDFADPGSCYVNCPLSSSTKSGKDYPYQYNDKNKPKNACVTSTPMPKWIYQKDVNDCFDFCNSDNSKYPIPYETPYNLPFKDKRLSDVDGNIW